MGLDMYLYAERYLSGYDHTRDEHKELYRTAVNAAGLADYKAPEMDSRHAEVNVCVAYWRKANAIHAWFLNKRGPRRHDPAAGDDQGLGDVIDDCRPIDVDIDDLRELYTLTLECIQHYQAGDHDLISEKLPALAGFFFGSTDIDEFFFHDLEITRDQLRHVIAAYDAEEKTAEAARANGEFPLWNPSFSYRASW